MNKLVLIGGGAVLLAAGGVAAWMLLSAPEPEPIPLDPYDYTDAASWDVKPAEQPPAVWDGGWAIDVVQLTSDMRRDPADIAAALDEIGPVYAPKLRAPNFAEDAAAALEEYLEASNNGRAFVIASDQPLPASTVPVINADPMVRARFGGVLLRRSGNGICARREPGERLFRPVWRGRSLRRGCGHQARRWRMGHCRRRAGGRRRDRRLRGLAGRERPETCRAAGRPGGGRDHRHPPPRPDGLETD